MSEKQILRVNLLSMQVCVSWDTTNAEVEDFANAEHPTGISSRWSIRKEGSPHLNGAAERVQCSQWETHCHIMLDC